MNISSLQKALCMRPWSWVSCYWLITAVWRAWLGNRLGGCCTLPLLSICVHIVIQRHSSVLRELWQYVCPACARLWTVCILHRPYAPVRMSHCSLLLCTTLINNIFRKQQVSGPPQEVLFQVLRTVNQIGRKRNFQRVCCISGTVKCSVLVSSTLMTAQRG